MGDKKVDTGGGAHIEGGVNISGGDFVGRDRVNVSGGFYQPGWNVAGNVTQATGDITQHFAPLEAAVRNAPPEAQAKVEKLKAEAAKGDSADDDKMADLIGDLGELVPSAVEALVGLFTASPLAKLAGGATKYVLRKLKK